MIGGLSEAEIKHIQQELFTVAYRMIRRVADSEDIVQDVLMASITLQKQLPTLQDVRYYLVRGVINRCLSFLEKQKRETYPGTDLPEPLEEATMITHQDVRFGTLLLLQRLNPYERAAFLLRTCFDLSYSEVAEILNKTEDNCRQLLHRASTKIKLPAKQMGHLEKVRAEKFIELFMEASRNGNLEPLIGLLKSEVVAYADGGGKASAALNPVYGKDAVSKYLLGLFQKFGPLVTVKPAMYNQSPAMVFINNGGVIETIMLVDFDGDNIEAIYFQRNPDKIKQ